MKKLQALRRMDRTIVKRTTLDQQGRDSGVPHATPVEGPQSIELTEHIKTHSMSTVPGTDRSEPAVIL